MGLHLAPNLALFLCIVLILWLFWIDSRHSPPVSSGLWVTVLWMVVTSSRPLSTWFGMSVEAAEGSPLERTVYSALIFAALVVLLRRRERFSFSGLVVANPALFLLLGYFAFSIVWSDFLFVSFKRYIKLLGMLTMILIILTDADIVSALRTSARRCGYVILPLSLILAKYFPSIGVNYDYWTGARTICGITSTKNMLGQVCLVFGLFFIWDFILRWRNRFAERDRLILSIVAFCVTLDVYLLLMSDSSTSLVCMVFGTGIMFATRYDFIQKRIGLYVLTGSIIFLVLNWSLDLLPSIIHALGRNMTFTDRTLIWQNLLPFAKANLWFGTGYENFWMGSRLVRIWDEAQLGQLNEAHNGYLEIVLNTGLVGLFFFCVFIISVYRRCGELLRSNPEYGRFAMGFFFMALVYNFTEAAFKNICIVMFVFVTIGLRLHEIDYARSSCAESGSGEVNLVPSNDCRQPYGHTISQRNEEI